MPKTVERPEPCVSMYTHARFFLTYVPMVKFNLEVRHSRRLTTIPADEIEEYMENLDLVNERKWFVAPLRQIRAPASLPARRP